MYKPTPREQDNPWEEDFTEWFNGYESRPPLSSHLGYWTRKIKELLAEERDKWGKTIQKMADRQDKIKEEYFKLGENAGQEKSLGEVKNLITEEILICHQEGVPTSRLTSLYNKLKK